MERNTKIVLFVVTIIILIYHKNKNIMALFEPNLIPYNYNKKKYDYYVRKGIKFNIDETKIKYFNKFNYTDLTKIKVKNDNKIFISVASYRDPECKNTINSIINNSDNPELLVIVVCEQNSIKDDFNLKINEIKTKAPIKIIKMNYKDARGPCWARFLIQQEWKGEEYYLQIDSHTKFVIHWDTKLKEELNKIPGKSCLSNYVGIYDVITQKPISSGLRGPLNAVSINKTDNFVRYNSNYFSFISKPLKSRGWSACFSFSKSDIIHDGGYDPYTPFLFFGEESDIFCRLYSRKWKFYVPSVVICYTCFNRNYRKTFWENPDYDSCNKMSKLRLYYKFGMLDNVDNRLLAEIDKYSLKNNVSYKECLEFMFNRKL